MHCGSEESPPLHRAALEAHSGRPGPEQDALTHSNPLQSTGGPTRADLNGKSPELSQLEEKHGVLEKENLKGGN